MLLDDIENLIQDKGPSSFKDIVLTLKVPVEKYSDLYNGLTLDPRFHLLEGNIWDVSTKYRFEEKYVHNDDDEGFDEFDSEDCVEEEDEDEVDETSNEESYDDSGADENINMSNEEVDE